MNILKETFSEYPEIIKEIDNLKDREIEYLLQNFDEVEKMAEKDTIENLGIKNITDIINICNGTFDFKQEEIKEKEALEETQKKQAIEEYYNIIKKSEQKINEFNCVESELREKLEKSEVISNTDTLERCLQNMQDVLIRFIQVKNQLVELKTKIEVEEQTLENIIIPVNILNESNLIKSKITEKVNSEEEGLLLLCKNFILNWRDDNGNTFLHRTIIDNKYVQGIEKLLDLNFKIIDCKSIINKQNKDGDTPLISAVKNGNSKICELLIENGADKNIKNNNGEYVKKVEEVFELVDNFPEYNVEVELEQETLDELKKIH